MNYANMIEEKNLKKTFIIATLCSTLIGTFTSSMGLWDRVNDRRKQKKKDTRQDGEIQQLREAVEKAEKRAKDREDDIRRHHDDIGLNFENSGALIQRQYDEGYGRLGRKFAVGDQITENQLQAQVIALQQTVINVLQNALYDDRQLSRADMAKLLAASNSAREGSLQALREQQFRLTEGFPDDAPPQRALPPPKRSSIISDPISNSNPLFCRYSLDLQRIANEPLTADFRQGGLCRCPDCGFRLGVEEDDFWKIGKGKPIIIKDGGYEKEVIDTREFHVGQRFIVKCHTSDGEFACVICNRHRDVDAICRSVDALVNHVGRYHDISELEREIDLRDKPVQIPLALPAPGPSPPPSLRDYRGIEVREYR